MNLRVDKILSELGICSRNDVKKLMKANRLTLNGEVLKDAAKKINTEKDELLLDGEPVVYEEFIYIMLNKPQGYICATEGNEPTVLDLLDETRRGLFPAGRLDKDTTGFVLITNDGMLAHNILAPKKHVDKEYIVGTRDPITEQNVHDFQKGIILEDGTECQDAVCIITAEKECRLIIKEGKYHQIKRMFEALGNQVISLNRIRIGDVVLDADLELGEYRELTSAELDSLKNRVR